MLIMSVTRYLFLLAFAAFFTEVYAMDFMTLILACSMYSDDAMVNAMVNVNSHGNPLVISGKPFTSENAALNYAKQQQAQGKTYYVGLMQIPSFWLPNYDVTLRELLRPCKNVVVATQILIDATEKCPDGSQTCALSTYQTKDPQAGVDYANQILQYSSDHPFVPPPPLE
jgi:hypothetical protein